LMLLKSHDLLYLAMILKFYVFIVGLICLLALLIGVWWLEGHVGNVPWLIAAWVIFVLANGGSLYSALNAAIINGLGYVSTSQKNETIASLISMFVFLGVAFISNSLLAPTIALMASTMVSIFLNQNSLRKIIPVLSDFKFTVKQRYLKALFTRVGPEMGKFFFMLLAFQLLTSVFVIMISFYEEARIVAAYGITMQLLTMILAFSNIWLTSSYPIMAAEKGNNDPAVLKEVFFSAVIRGLMLLLAGVIILIFTGDFFLGLIGSKVFLLPMDILLVVIFVVIVEYVSSLMAQLLASQCHLRFAYYSISGSIIIGLTGFALLEYEYGVVAMFFSRLVIYVSVIMMPIVKDCVEVLSKKEGI